MKSIDVCFCFLSLQVMTPVAKRGQNEKENTDLVMEPSLQRCSACSSWNTGQSGCDEFRWWPVVSVAG